MTTSDINDRLNIKKQELERRLPLEKFIPSVFLVFLLCIIILSFITYYNIEEYKKDVSLINHIQDVIKENDKIKLLTVQQIFLTRNYITTGDSTIIQTYRVLHNNLLSEITQLKDFTKDNPKQHYNSLLLDSVISIQSSYLDSIIHNQTKSNPGYLLNMSYRLQGQTEQISALSKNIENEELILLQSRTEKAISSNSDIQLFIIITGLFGFLVIGLSLYVSNKLIKNKKTTEKLLVKSYKELEDKVKVRTDALKNSNEKLVEEIVTREKTEKTLRESEKRFKVMADSAPVLIWILDANMKITYINKLWIDFTGRNIGSNGDYSMDGLIHPDDVQRSAEIYENAFRNKKIFEMEFRLKNKDGEFRWLLDRGVPRFEGNEFIGYIGTCIDIHALKINERYLNIQYAVSKTLTELNRIEEILNKVLENICTEVNWDFGILWLVDNSNSILKIEAMWSVSVPEVKRYSEMFDKQHNFSIGEGLPGRVWKDKKAIWIHEIKDDSNFPRKQASLDMGWHSAIGVPIINGGEVVAVIELFNAQSLTSREDLLLVLESVGRQIGNFIIRKIAEEDVQKAYVHLEDKVKDRTVELANTLSKLLKEIEQKEQAQSKIKLFAYAIKGLKECVYITDLNYKTLFVNEAFEEVFCYDEKEIINKEIPILNEFHLPVSLRKEIENKTLKGGWKGEFLTKRKDGTEFYVYLSTSIIYNEAGAVEAIIGICEDITDDKKADELINKRNNLLYLINDIILLTNKTFNLNEVISHSINQICRYTKWDVGHCFFIDNSALVSSKIWNDNIEDKYIGFKAATEKIKFKTGEGMPGNTFATGKSAWVNLKVLTDKNLFSRADLIKEPGLKTGIWAPILQKNEVIGVLEFYKQDESPLDKEVLDSIENIGIEIGNVAEHAGIIEKITKSEMQFKAVSDTANDAIITADNNGNIVYVNNSVEKIFGYSVEEILTNNLKILMPEKFKQMHESAFSAAVKNGHSKLSGKTLELTGRRKNGEEFPLELSIAEWENNGELFFTGMIKDITIRKSTEKELLQKQQIILQAQQIAKLGSWEWNINSDEVTWSDEMYEIYGIEKDNFGASLDAYKALIHSDDLELVKNTVENGHKYKKPFNYFHRIITPAGVVKILNAQGDVHTNDEGEVDKLFGTAQDVTKIKQAEEKLRENERQLQEAQHIAKIGSWEYIVKDKSTCWSDELYRIWGYKPGEIQPQFDSIKHLIHPADQNIIELITESVKEQNPINQDFRVVSPEGRLKYLHIEVLVEYDENNNPKRVYGSIQDITQMKFVEDELRKTNEMLIQAQKDLLHNEKLAALGRFSSGIAHEIRNPLANISALAQIVSKVNLDEKSKKHLKYILINADLANKIIKDLLNFASPEDLTFEYEELSEIINTIVESIEPRCIEARVKVETFISPDLPNVYIDKLRIENAFMNFASNAIDAMAEGGKLSIIAGEDKINKEIIIQFVDTGIGIDPENLDKILEPFYTTKAGGTGLGMGLAYHTIKSHMGDFNIKSEPGEGTQIEIKLPIKK